MENEISKIKDQCIVCGLANPAFFINKNGHNIYRCLNCGILFVAPTPLDSNKVYSDDYFLGAKNGFGYVNYEQDKPVMSKTFKIYLAKIERFCPPGRKLLDIGAATGYFLQLANEMGWQSSGVEISAWAADKGRAKGLDIMTGTLRNIDTADLGQVYDVITMWDVLEHLPDPISNLKIAHKFLKKNGIIAINTPDASSLYAKIIGKRWHLFVPPEHLFYFNRTSLNKLLGNTGFQTVYMGKISKKFSIQYICKIMANWQRSRFFNRLADTVEKSAIGRISLPINLRDNIFVIARKV